MSVEHEIGHGAESTLRKLLASSDMFKIADALSSYDTNYIEVYLQYPEVNGKHNTGQQKRV